MPLYVNMTAHGVSSGNMMHGNALHNFSCGRMRETLFWRMIVTRLALCAFTRAERDDMHQPWTRLTLEFVRPDFVSMLSDAQRYCYSLRRVRVISYEVYEYKPARNASRVVILAPPEMMAIWNAPAPGELSLETIAASSLMGVATLVLENAGELIPF